MSKQKLDFFTLDLKDIQEQDLASADKTLQDALAETSMRSVFVRLDRLYQDEREHDSEYKRKPLQELAPLIEKALIDFGETDRLALTDTNQVIGTASSNDGPYLHLAFILQAIKHNRQIDDIMHGFTDDSSGTKIAGLIDRYEEQFYKKDFERSNFKIIDQDGKIMIENLPIHIYSTLEQTGQERSPANIKAQLKETLKLSDEQLKFIISKCNQRNIEGMGTAFTPSDDMAGRLLQGDKKDRANIIHVTTEEVAIDQDNKIISTDSLEHQFTSMRLSPDSDDKIPDYQVSYFADISNLNRNAPKKLSTGSPFKQAQYDSVARDFVALPSQEAKAESLTFDAIHPDAAYALPPQLLAKAVNIIEHQSRSSSIDATDIDSQSFDSSYKTSPTTIEDSDLDTNRGPRNRRSSSAFELFNNLSADALDKLNEVRGRINSVISPATDDSTDSQSSTENVVSPLKKLRERAGSVFK